MFAHSAASMSRFGGVTDFLPSLFVRVPELCPAALFFSSLQTVMPESARNHIFMSTNLRRADDRCLTLKQSRKQEFPILGARFKGGQIQHSCRLASHALPRAAPPELRQKNTECRSGIFRTSLGRRPSILAEHAPKKACGLFTFDPLVLPDLFFDKVGDPVERIGIKSARSSQRWEWISRTRLLRTDPKR
jgi:hypothetical protein